MPDLGPFKDFIARLLAAHPELNNNQILTIIKLVCKFGQPFLDTVCPLVNVGDFPKGVVEAHQDAIDDLEPVLHDAIEDVRNR